MQGELRYNEPLAQHTSWHIGGPADRYYRPKDLQDLQAFLKTLTLDEPLTWLGLGSNVLINDKGLKGTVIHTLGMKSEIQAITPTLLRIEAGIPCAKVAKFCTKHNLKGGEFFAGIPGTVGGALKMNAGAFGGETWRQVTKIEVINRKGEITIRTPDEYEIGYRSVRKKEPQEEWFIAGYFQFEEGNMEQASEEIKALLKKRNNTQPIGVFSCGSVFTNPKNDYAARLIESLGLKGKKIGDAQISEKHANFIINTDKATAKDVLQLMAEIIEKVYQNYEIILSAEVKVLGFEDPMFWYPKLGVNAVSSQ